LTASVLPAEAPQGITWSSSNTNVATVTSGGLVYAKSVGNAVITARSTADTSKYATCSVTVEELLYYSLQEELCSWLVVEDPIFIPVAYYVTLNSFINIDYQASPSVRRVNEVSAFTKLDRPPSGLNVPELSIGVTHINDDTISMYYFDDILIGGDWEWDCKEGHPDTIVGSSATFDTLAIAWLSDTVYPYQDVTCLINF